MGKWRIHSLPLRIRSVTNCGLTIYHVLPLATTAILTCYIIKESNYPQCSCKKTSALICVVTGIKEIVRKKKTESLWAIGSLRSRYPTSFHIEAHRMKTIPIRILAWSGNYGMKTRAGLISNIWNGTHRIKQNFNQTVMIFIISGNHINRSLPLPLRIGMTTAGYQTIPYRNRAGSLLKSIMYATFYEEAVVNGISPFLTKLFLAMLWTNYTNM